MFDLSLPNILLGLLFSAIGFIAFQFGRKDSRIAPTIIGAILMGYPIFVANTYVLTGIGILLCIALYIWRE